jgi:NADPH2:quinone reductase
VLADLAAGRLDIPITDVDGLEGAAAAQQALADGEGSGKYVVDVRT